MERNDKIKMRNLLILVVVRRGDGLMKSVGGLMMAEPVKKAEEKKERENLLI